MNSNIFNTRKVQLLAFTALGLATAGTAAVQSNHTANADERANVSTSKTVNADHNATSKAVKADNTYTVKSGDTLSGIAAKYNTTVDKLEKSNNLQSPDIIFVGDNIKIRSEAKDTYTVKAGDTLSGIAGKYNTSVTELRSANNLSSDLIQVGQVLKLHADKVTVSVQPQTQTVQPQVQAQTQTVQPQAAQSSAQQAPQAPVVQSSRTHVSASTGNSSSAKEWIAQRESSGNYAASNGRYFGRYQLDKSYLHGDYSPANQERVANNYVSSRYGSWENAKSFWQQHGWY